MGKKYFLPRADLEKQQWLQNFASKLPNYASKYNIAANDVAAMATASANFSFWLDYRNQYEEYLKKLTQYKNELRDGVPAGASPSIAPVPPAITVFPPDVPPGIIPKAVSIAGIIKKTSSYTIADGNDLGIEGPEDITDLQSQKPIITIRLVDGGKPELQWKKNGMDGIEIFVDRGDGKFVFLAIDTYPDYIDSTPLPDGITSAIWKYRSIYRYDDGQVGQWSDIASITVSAR